jgi:kumamolisin
MNLKCAGILGLVTTLSISSAKTAWAESTQVILGLQKQVDMEALAKSVTDTSSPRYQKFYTTEEIKQLAAPTDSDYQSALQKLQSDGVTIVSESPSHLFITVRGERSYFVALDNKLNSAFQSFVSLYSKPTIARVHGLVQGTPRRPRMKFLPMDGSAAASFSGITPAQIQSSYGFDAIYNMGISGQGQDIAIATYDGFLIGDVTDYYTKNGINTTRTVDQITFNGTPKFSAMSATETQTDAEFSGMIAPGANIHIYASADNGDAGELAMFTKILDDGVSKIINYSWGTCETEVTAAHRSDMDQVFARAVAQGVNITVATGDSGSDCLGNKTTVADFPAVEPYIVAVGGTTLTPANSGYGSEAAWSGSGGGVSTLYGAASFQSELPSPYNGHRSYPDVAFNADPNSGEPTWVHLDPQTNKKSKTAQYIVIGGTSIAAPQWAGFLALVNQARGSAIGYIDPIIYSLASSSQSIYFNDITTGSDGSYSAAVGWDAVTGWGSMKADRLLAELKSQ